jgi:hypothetical protein
MDRPRLFCTLVLFICKSIDYAEERKNDTLLI